jgi:hypothetical protein
MLNSTTHSEAQRHALGTRVASSEERLPVTDECRSGLSNLAIGLVGALVIAAALLLAHFLLAI